MIAVTIVSDRGSLYLPGCKQSLREHLDRHADVFVVDDQEHNLGMAGAVRTAWEWAVETGCDYLLHIEEDFRFLGQIPLDGMLDVLSHDETLAQVVLKRQPWSPEEFHAGGIIETHPDDYTDHHAGGLQWVSHQRIFSLNPCLIPRKILEYGWPDGNEAEMTSRLVADGWRFAFYGHRADPPRVEHIGASRGKGWRL